MGWPKGRPKKHPAGCRCAFHSGKGFKPGHDPRRKHPENCGCAFHNDAAGARQRTAATRKRRRRLTLDELLVKNAQHRVHPQVVKGRMVEAGLLKDRCGKCGVDPVWQGKSLVLQLDHIDGDSHNWERQNLRVLCPNCHTQTPTWGRRTRAHAAP